VREAYRALARESPARWVILDAALSPEALEGLVAGAVEARLPG
jgi:thymidylate kinase